MKPINGFQQAPSTMDFEQAAKSAIKTNKSVEAAVMESIQKEVQRSQTVVDQNIAVIAAQTTGKGTLLDIIA